MYREPQEQEARIIGVLELPEARRLLKAQKSAALFFIGLVRNDCSFQ